MSKKNKHVRFEKEDKKPLKPDNLPDPAELNYIRLHPDDRKLLLDVLEGLEALKAINRPSFDPQKIMDNLKRDVRTGEPINKPGQNLSLTGNANDID